MPGDSEESLFPEHHFLLACLKLGLTIQDLRFLTYIDVMKIFLSIERGENTKKNTSRIRKATQADIDKLLR